MSEDKLKAMAELLGVAPDRLLKFLEEEHQSEEPSGTLDGFYFNPEVFRKLHEIDSKGLRDLVVPNISKLRR